ncbi:MAG: DUF2062 domain-containing protein [Candidatus Omnitrophica bacterium]|nr:DUF2062 domain-containing protein [Candidatus Omnitrophota bacterium]
MKTAKSFLIKIAERIKNIARSDSTPEKIAGSIALGTFIGSLPITGFQNLITILLSVILRLNKIGSVLSLEMYSNLVTLPFICYADFRIGSFLLGRQPELLKWTDFRHPSWKIVSKIAETLFIGGLFLGIVVSGIAYLIALKLITTSRKKMRKKQI